MTEIGNLTIYTSPLETLVFVLIAIVVLFELFSQLTWLPLYFKHGFTIFKFKITNNDFSFPVEELNSRFKDEGPAIPFTLIPSIKFKEVAKNKCAFRESRWLPSLYVPILHGLLVYKPDNKKVKVKCAFNLTPLVLLISSLIFDYLKNPEIKSADFFLIFFGLSLIIQLVRIVLLILDCKRFFQWIGQKDFDKKSRLSTS